MCAQVRVCVFVKGVKQTQEDRATELLTEKERELLRSTAEELKRLCVIMQEERALIDMETERLKREYSRLFHLTEEERELLREGAENAKAEFKQFLDE